MAWYIAPIPFWLTGALFTVALPMVYIYRKPKETDRDLVCQFFASLIMSGASLSVAAWMVS